METEAPRSYTFLAFPTTQLADILKNVQDWESLRHALRRLCRIQTGVINFDGLKVAIARFTAFMDLKMGVTGWDFYSNLLPQIIKWATSKEDDFDIELDVHGFSSKTVFTSKQARFVLANAFFLNIRELQLDDKHSFGWLDFTSVYCVGFEVGPERIACQLSYFQQAMQDEDREIIFERIFLKESPDWENCDLKITRKIFLHDKRIEDTDSTVHVDFANKYIHIGQIIPSCTQEEVIFSCCPEAFLSLIFCDMMWEREAVVIRGLRRYSEYTGYLHTFKFTGFSKPMVVDFLAIDAVMNNHFSLANNIRDLNKAYLGFQPFDKRISTGHWGCGAFGGDKSHKFIQQIMAATLADKELDYSCFKESNSYLMLTKLYDRILKQDLTVGQLYKLLVNYQPRSPEPFQQYITRVLQK